MKNFNLLYLYLLLIFFSKTAIFAQISINITNNKLGYSVCAGEVQGYGSSYTVNSPVNNLPTKYIWTVTSGIIQQNNSTTIDRPAIDVKWNDYNGTGAIRLDAYDQYNNFLGSQTSQINIKSFNGVNPGSISSSVSTINNGTVSIAADDNSAQVFSIPVPSFQQIGTYDSERGKADSFEWRYPSGWTVSSSTLSNSITLIPSGGCQGGTIQVRAVGCGGSTKSNWSDPITVTRTAPTTTPVFSAYQSVFCKSETNTFSINAYSGAVSYDWLVADGFTINGANSLNGTTSTSINITAPNSEGFYSTVKVRANLGSCGSTPWASFQTWVGPAILNGISIDGNGARIGTGTDNLLPTGSHTITVSGSGFPIYSYTVISTTPISGSNGNYNILIKRSTDLYAITFKVSNRCGNQTALVVVGGLNANYRMASKDKSSPGANTESFLPYPNPTTGTITIAPVETGTIENIKSINVYNLQGVITRKIDIQTKDNIYISEGISIDTKGLQTGTYIISIEYKDGTTVRNRVIVQ